MTKTIEKTNTLRKELEAEEKAVRKAEAMEILRQVSSKDLAVKEELLKVESKIKQLEELRSETYAAYEASDALAIAEARTKLSKLGF